MIARPTRWVLPAILLFLVAGVALAITLPLVMGTAPTSSAQVGVPYTSALSASGGTRYNYYYSIVANPNLLPTGLVLNSTSGAITGTPQVAGTFSFTGVVSDFVDDPPAST